jgi:glucose/arabinose dehydrogenase
VTRSASIAALALGIVLAACGDGGGATPTPTSVPATAKAPPTTTAAPPTPVALPQTDPAAEISLPAGFTAFAVATGFSSPTSVALAPDGTIYVSERFGAIYRLADADGDGVFENVLIADGFTEVTGLAVSPAGAVYVSSRGRVSVLDGAGGATDIITDLPRMRHQNNGIAFGPDGKLYVTNGSTCDDCVESNPLSATILEANPDGSDLRVYARGLRNPYDLAFDPLGRLWATDNGSDEPCETVDELNLIVEGGDFGWPYAADGCDPFADGIPPVASLGLHTASTGIDYNDGLQFPDHIYADSLFLTLWGSFVYEPELGPALIRARIVTEGGSTTAVVETFGTGFLAPIDVVFDRDGTLLALDYTRGILYRIVYTGG